MALNMNFISAFILLIGLNANAQEELYMRQGLIKSTASIAPSTMLNRSVNNIYLSGFLEYHIEKNISFRGDCYWFVDGKIKNPTSELFVRQAMRVYFGPYFHKNVKNWDNYIGLQPGIALMRPLNEQLDHAPLQASPSFAVHVGSTYFVWKFFNFYVDLAYVSSVYHGFPTGGQRTDELILSAGLGFQLNTKKAK